MMIGSRSLVLRTLKSDECIKESGPQDIKSDELIEESGPQELKR